MGELQGQVQVIALKDVFRMLLRGLLSQRHSEGRGPTQSAHITIAINELFQLTYKQRGVKYTHVDTFCLHPGLCLSQYLRLCRGQAHRCIGLVFSEEIHLRTVPFLWEKRDLSTKSSPDSNLSINSNPPNNLLFSLPSLFPLLVASSL